MGFVHRKVVGKTFQRKTRPVSSTRFLLTADSGKPKSSRRERPARSRATRVESGAMDETNDYPAGALKITLVSMVRSFLQLGDSPEVKLTLVASTDDGDHRLDTDLDVDELADLLQTLQAKVQAKVAAPMYERPKPLKPVH